MIQIFLETVVPLYYYYHYYFCSKHKSFQLFFRCDLLQLIQYDSVRIFVFYFFKSKMHGGVERVSFATNK